MIKNNKIMIHFWKNVIIKKLNKYIKDKNIRKYKKLEQNATSSNI